MSTRTYEMSARAYVYTCDICGHGTKVEPYDSFTCDRCCQAYGHDEGTVICLTTEQEEILCKAKGLEWEGGKRP